MATVLYVPGYGETHDGHNAEAVFSAVEARGDEGVFVSLDWQQTITEWTDELGRRYAKCDPLNTTIVAMSLGAVAALVTVATTDQDRQPARLCLLSLSARFKEDFPNLPKAAIDFFTVEQQRAFKKLCFNVLAPQVMCPTLLAIGAREYEMLPTLATRVHKAQELIPNAKLVVAHRSGHNLSHSGYKQVIAAEI